VNGKVGWEKDRSCISMRLSFAKDLCVEFYFDDEHAGFADGIINNTCFKANPSFIIS
jgi:hypothetical protein